MKRDRSERAIPMLRSLSRKRLAYMLILSSRVTKRVHERLTRHAFAQFGGNFRFDPNGTYTYSTIYIGDHVSIGIGAVIFAVAPAYIEIRNNVMLGPHVSLISGDHVFDVPGSYMTDLHVKRPGDDLPITIESDVWIGANATILKGVTIGRGSIVAAGSVVTGSVAPYSIVGGIPARKLRDRFAHEEMAVHELFLGPETRLRGLPDDPLQAQSNRHLRKIPRFHSSRRARI